MNAQYEFGVLGPLEVKRDGVRVHIGSARQRGLLAALLVDAGQVVSVDALVGRLWGEDPPHGARNAVQNYVLRVRRTLGPDVVLTDRCGYMVDVAPGDLDARRFASLVRWGAGAASAGEVERAAALLDEALGLWRGEPLSDLPAERFQDVAAALGEQRLSAQELWIDAVIRCGRPADALPELHRLIQSHPLRERFWSQRMLALYQCGRQGEALECYRRVTRLLADELGIDPGDELRTLHRRILESAPEIAAAPAVPRTTGDQGNLPAETTSFVGREKELDETRRLLRQARLVTLTGAGGVGKTRLALRAAAQMAPSFPDGVWLADLAALTDPNLAERAVAESLGLRDQSVRSASDALVDHVRDRRLLLVLDNCEHLVDAVAALVLPLLSAAPGLRVLATSRERLGVPGEHVFLVSGLGLRDDADGRACEAMRLLIDRAAACAAPLRAGEHDVPAAELCRRLDGIPLAIELAAVRLSSLTVAEILERLETRFHLLSAPWAPDRSRHRRTLRDVMDLSYSLCTPGERQMWNRLSVFAGGFDLDAAEAVCAGDGIDGADVLELMTGLIHKSIVIVEDDGGAARYRLLETIRQYGLDRLGADGDATGYRIRHSDHYRALAGSAAAGWCGPREAEWLDRLRTELPNLRAALSFCLTRPDRARTGAGIAVDLTRTRSWFFAATLGEARHWLEAMSACLGPDGGEAAVLVTAMKTFVACVQGDQAAAQNFMNECDPADVSLARVAPVVYVEGVHSFLVLGDPACIDRFARAREMFLSAGHTGDAHMATMFWAMAAAFMGDPTIAVSTLDTYVAEATAASAEWACTWAQWCTGLTELLHGCPGRALMPLCDALVRQQAIDDRWGPAWTVEALAWTAGALGHHHHAAQLLGAAHHQRQATGAALTGLKPLHALHTRTTRLMREHLEPHAYNEAWKRGARAEDGIALSLGIAHEVFQRATPGK